jgi:hypothetical protein
MKSRFSSFLVTSVRSEAGTAEVWKQDSAVEGDDKFYALMWIAEKTTKHWFSLMFLVDMAHD